MGEERRLKESVMKKVAAVTMGCQQYRQTHLKEHRT